MDPATLGLTVASLMAKKAIEAAGNKAGDAGWGVLSGLADRVRTWLAADPDAARTLEAVEQYPDSERAVEALATKIEAAAAADPSGAATIETQVARIEHLGDREVTNFIGQIRDDASVGRIIQVSGDYNETRHYAPSDQESRE